MDLADRIGTIDGDGTGPLYLRFQALLRKAIDAGTLAAEEALPSERELCGDFDISRITVRRAIGGLVEEGRLVRRQGAGTFVAATQRPGEAARVEKSFSHLSSFSEDMAARGLVPSSEWISGTNGLVTPEEALSLALSPGTPVYRLQRLRKADGRAMALEYSTIAGYCLGSLDAVGASLYQALEAHGHRPVRALQRLRAVPFKEEQARLLEVEPGHAGLLIERRSFLADGRAAELTFSYYRGDAYDFVAELSDM